MINLLMRNTPIVLQHIVILGSGRFDEFLYYRLGDVSLVQRHKSGASQDPITSGAFNVVFRGAPV